MSTTKPPRKFIKYGNWKLHEVGSKKAYLAGHASLVQILAKGDAVEIIDDVTGEDITVAVLARVVYDICRADSTAVDGDALRDLVVEAHRRQAVQKKIDDARGDKNDDGKAA